jgi:hypothetical protein
MARQGSRRHLLRARAADGRGRGRPLSCGVPGSRWRSRLSDHAPRRTRSYPVGQCRGRWRPPAAVPTAARHVPSPSRVHRSCGRQHANHRVACVRAVIHDQDGVHLGLPGAESIMLHHVAQRSRMTRDEVGRCGALGTPPTPKPFRWQAYASPGGLPQHRRALEARRDDD